MAQTTTAGQKECSRAAEGRGRKRNRELGWPVGWARKLKGSAIGEYTKG